MSAPGWIVSIGGEDARAMYFAGRRPREFFKGVFRPQDLHRCYRFETSPKEAHQFEDASSAFEVMSVIEACGSMPRLVEAQTLDPVFFVVDPGDGQKVSLSMALRLAGSIEGGRIMKV